VIESMVGAEGFEPPTLCSQSVPCILPAFTMESHACLKMFQYLELEEHRNTLVYYGWTLRVPTISPKVRRVRSHQNSHQPRGTRGDPWRRPGCGELC
jgi:hypothetical protein